MKVKLLTWLRRNLWKLIFIVILCALEISLIPAALDTTNEFRKEILRGPDFDNQITFEFGKEAPESAAYYPETIFNTTMIFTADLAPLQFEGDVNHYLNMQDNNHMSRNYFKISAQNYTDTYEVQNRSLSEYYLYNFIAHYSISSVTPGFQLDSWVKFMNVTWQVFDDWPIPEWDAQISWTNVTIDIPGGLSLAAYNYTDFQQIGYRLAGADENILYEEARITIFYGEAPPIAVQDSTAGALHSSSGSGRDLWIGESWMIVIVRWLAEALNAWIGMLFTWLEDKLGPVIGTAIAAGLSGLIYKRIKNYKSRKRKKIKLFKKKGLFR